VVMDNEAGMEHLSRRTASRIDHLIVVVNDNPLAIDCATRIDALLNDLGRVVGNKYLLLNAVNPDRVEAVQDEMAGLSLEFLAAVPPDQALPNALIRHKPVYELENTPAIQIMTQVMQRIGVD